MNRVHLVPSASEANGIWRAATIIAASEDVVLAAGSETSAQLVAADEVWVHGMWLPRLWRSAWRALRSGRPLVRMTHGSLSPVYLNTQSPVRKRLVRPIERWLFARSSRIVFTGEWEREWYERSGFAAEGVPIDFVDLKRGFSFRPVRSARPCRRLLYLGQRHPLKGVDQLEEAVAELNRRGVTVELRMESSVFGEAKESAFEWCDALVLPTMSDNFGLVVAEALAHGRRAIVTDGAPAWRNEPGVTFIDGYVAASRSEQVAMMVAALANFIRGECRREVD